MTGRHPTGRGRDLGFLLALVALAMALAGPLATQAAARLNLQSGSTCDDSWATGVSGTWSTAADWSTGKVPSSTQNACITASGTYTVTLNGGQSVGALTLGDGGSSGTQTLDVQGISGSSATLSIGGASTVESDGDLQLDSTNASQSSAFSGPGTLTVDTGGDLQTLQDQGDNRYLRAPIVNDGTVEIGALDTIADQSNAIVNAGTWTIDASAGLMVSNGSFDNQGSVVNNGSFGANGIKFTQEGTGDTGNAPVLDGNATLADSSGGGLFSLEGSDTLSGTVPSGQTVTILGISGSSATTALASAGVTNDGTIALDSNNSSQTSALTGSGMLTNDGTLQTVQDQGDTRELRAPIVNDGTVEIGAANTIADQTNAIVNDGTWTIDSSAGLDMTAGSFNNEGSLANSGSFTVSGITFTQDGSGNTGNAPVLNGNATLADSTGAGSFNLEGSDTLSGTVPSGQTVTILGIIGSSASTAVVAGGVTNDGTVALDSNNASQYSILAGSGTLTNDGTLQTVEDQGNSRYLRAPIVNNGTVDIGATDTLADQSNAFLNNGTWEIDAAGGLDMTGGSFDDKGVVANNGSFTVSGIKFTQEGTGNTGNAPVLNGNATLADSSGGGSFNLEGSDTLSGTVPSGQTVTILGISGSSATTALASAGVTNDGTLAVSSNNSSQNAILAGSGTLTNDGVLETVQGSGNTRYLRAPITNNGLVEIGAATTDADQVDAIVNNGTWQVDAAGGLDMTNGSFDDKGELANNGSFTASGITFTQEGSGNTGNAPVLNGNATLADSTGAGSFSLEGSDTLSGTVPSGQTVTILGIIGSSATTSIASGGVTNDGTVALDSNNASQYAIVEGPGTLTNNGTFETLQDAGNGRYIRASLVNDGTVQLGAADTIQDQSTTSTNDGTWIIQPDVLFHATNGNFTQGSGGTLEMTLDPTNTSATGITGNGATTALAGTLQVTTLGSVSTGTAFTAIAEPRSGTFSTTDYVGPSYGTPVYNSNSVVLTATSDTLAVGTATFPNAPLSASYSQTLEPSGGTGPYTWAITNGSLPAGLNLDTSTGAITGTPDGTPGTSTFTAQVTDNNSNTASASLSITVPSQGVQVSNTSLAAGGINVSGYSQQLQATGGSGSYTWMIKTGSLPTGLTLDQSTGAITGTPTGPAGTSNFVVEATDTSSPPQNALQLLSIRIAPAPLSVTTSSLPGGQIGSSYDQTVAATGGTIPYTWSISSGSLPGGLTLNTATGEITGTPSGPSGTSNFTVMATDSSQPQLTASQPLSITIAPAALAIGTTSLPGGQVGVAYSQSVSASGGTTPYTWSISNGSLPDGLVIDPSTGAITGTPKPDAGGATATFTVQVTDNGNPQQTQSQQLSIAVAPATLEITTGALPGGQAGSSYNQTVTATGGTGTYTWSISSGSLPSPLTIDSSTGEITGTPAAATAGETFDFTVEAKDQGNPQQTATQALSIAIAPATLTIGTTSLQGGQIGASYNQPLSASGGTTPYTWSLVAGDGSLPAGLSLSGGSITGTPTGPVGTADFTVKVVDNGNPQQSTTQALSIKIAPATLAVSTTSLPGGTVGVAYSHSVAATGGTTPYIWSLVSGDGSLPPGLTLTPGTGLISGTPTGSGGTSNFTVQVSDSGSPQQTATKALSITIPAPPPTLSIGTSSLPGGTVGTAYSQSVSVSASGGTTPYTWSISSGSLPAGLGISPSTGAITGTPTGPGGTSSFTVKVVDSGTPQQTATKALSITITVPVATLKVTTTSLPQGLIGAVYGQTLAASGGTAPYTWSISSGSLPPGLTLTPPTGVLTGEFTAGGKTSFTVKVTDSSTPVQTATEALSITVQGQGPLYGVSCPSANDCTAVGIPNPPVETWDGTSWTPSPATSANSRLEDVSCISASACIAVGLGGPTSVPAAESWNGSSWTNQSIPAPGGAANDWLTSVSCPFAINSCIAVGSDDPTGGIGAGLAEVLVGSTWSIKTMPAPITGGTSWYILDSVSCPSAGASSGPTGPSAPSFCMAVGYYRTGENAVAKSFAEKWTGASWSLLTTANASGSGSTELNGVSCTSPTACTAVGGYSTTGTNTNLPYAEQWNGSSWTAHIPPNQSGSSFTNLAAVSCVTVGSCEAVGQTGSGSGPFAEGWNGSSWAIQPTPSLTNAFGALNAVSCTTGPTCAAVGYEAPTGETPLEFVDAPLAETLTGGSWLQTLPPFTIMIDPSGVVVVSDTLPGAGTLTGYIIGGVVGGGAVDVATVARAKRKPAKSSNILGRATIKVTKAKTVHLKLTPNAKTRAYLKKHHKLSVTIELVFKPKHGKQTVKKLHETLVYKK